MSLTFQVARPDPPIYKSKLKKGKLYQQTKY